MKKIIRYEESLLQNKKDIFSTYIKLSQRDDKTYDQFLDLLMCVVQGKRAQ